MPNSHDPFRETNPYAPPEASLSEAPPTNMPSDVAAAEIVRKAHLNHEWSIKSLGALHLIGAVIYTVILIGMGTMYYSGADQTMREVPAPVVLGVGLVVAAVVALSYALGFGLRGLKPWARWLDVVLIGASLFVNGLSVLFQAATQGSTGMGETLGLLLCSSLIPGYVLYLLLSSKGSVVFSPEYKEVIALTPHVQYKTSLVLKIALAFLIALLAMGVLAALLVGVSG